MKKSIFLGIFLALCWAISRHTLLQTLPLYDGDGHIHYKQLIDMWSGICTLNPFKLFSFNLNYGTPYFFAALIFSIPGQLLHNDTLFILAPRLVSALCAFGTLLLLYSILKHYTKEWISFGLSLLLCFMPAFWILTRMFRPDWALAACTMLFVYFLLKDKSKFGSEYWKSAGFFGLAIATKTQAIMFIPILIAYCFQSVFFDSFRSVFSKDLWVRFFKTIGISILVFIVINPHCLHPVGFYGIVRRFHLEWVQMAPQQGAEGFSFFERLHFVSQNLIAAPLLAIAFFLGLWSLVYLLQTHKKPELFSVILGSMPCYVFLLIISNKCNWNFLISAIPFLALYSITALNKLSTKVTCIILSICFGFGIYTITPFLTPIFKPDFSEINTPYSQNTTLVVPLLKPYEAHLHYIGVSNSAIFDYKELGLTFPQVRVLLGLLDTWQINPYAHEAHWHGLRVMQKKCGLSRFSIKPYYPRQALVVSKDHPFVDTNVLSDMLANKTDYYLLGQNQNVYVFIHKKLL